MKSNPQTPNNTAEADDAAAVNGVSGAHLAKLWNADPTDALSSVVPAGRAEVIVDWLREAIYHGRDMIDPATGKPDRDPWLEDIPVIPLDMVAEGFADRGVAVPTRQETREFAEADGSPDPEDELLRARYVPDPDLDAAVAAAEPRINGVPKSIYDALTDDERAKVNARKVIAPPQAPTAVAHWLVREVFSRRLMMPPPKGKPNRRRRAWMPTLVRIDQTWCSYERTAAGDPPRWVAHTDPEWMRGQLREALKALWYVKTRQLQSGNEYSLKWWNPDTRTLAMVEDALADALNVGTGTAPRELADIYGRHHGVYGGGTRVLVRNGVLDLETGALAQNTPLWFSLSRIEADYDHRADPYAASEWLTMLMTQWGDDPDAITCLQEWFGYVLSGRTDLQKWMLIVGPSGSGKSIIAEVLGALMGTVAATSLDELNGQFGLQAFYETGAALAVLSDIRFSTRDSSTAVGNLLAVTGEDTLHIARKYKVTVAAKLGVRFHASANEIPRWSDNSGALQKRALLLETTRSFRGTADEDPGLKKRIITDELGLVLRWAVEGLALLDAAGGAFTQTRYADELAQEVNDKAAPVRRFIAECCQIGEAEAHRHGNCGCAHVDSARLFEVWKAWATTNGHRPGSHTAFRSALKALYLDPIKPGQLADGGQRVVWGITHAETTYIDKGQYGVPIERTVSTTGSGDPMHGGGSLN